MHDRRKEWAHWVRDKNRPIDKIVHNFSGTWICKQYNKTWWNLLWFMFYEYNFKITLHHILQHGTLCCVILVKNSENRSLFLLRVFCLRFGRTCRCQPFGPKDELVGVLYLNDASIKCWATPDSVRKIYACTFCIQ